MNLGWGYFKTIAETSELHIGFAILIYLSLYLYKNYRERHENTKVVRQEQLETFIKVLSSKLKSNTFIIEQAFENKFGKSLSYYEIKYFLKFPNATQSIKMYLNSRSYFEFEPYNDIPELKKKYKSRPTLIKLWRLGCYFVLAGMAFYSISFQMFVMREVGPYAFLLSLSLAVYFIFVAILSLDSASKLSTALSLNKQIEKMNIRGVKWRH